MKLKKTVSLLLGLCLILSALTVSADLSLNDSTRTVVGSFSLQLPEGYELDEEMTDTEKNKYTYELKENGETKAMMILASVEASDSDIASFKKNKASLLTNSVQSALTGFTCKGTEARTYAGCEAVAGVYADSSYKSMATLILREDTKEALFALLMMGYYTDGTAYVEAYEAMLQGMMFTDGTAAPSQEVASGKNGVTLENYNKIKTGMTYKQVCDIFGKEGVKLSEVDIGMKAYKTEIYAWYDASGIFSADITFMGGKVYAMAQLGLQ